MYVLLGQKMVDDADTFPAVLERVVAWLQERELGAKYKYTMLTDGYVPKISYFGSKCKFSLLLMRHRFCILAFRGVGLNLMIPCSLFYSMKQQDVSVIFHRT